MKQQKLTVPEVKEQDYEIPPCTIFIPGQTDIEMCPCGGHGYCDINEKWYSLESIRNLPKNNNLNIESGIKSGFVKHPYKGVK